MIRERISQKHKEIIISEIIKNAPECDLSQLGSLSLIGTGLSCEPSHDIDIMAIPNNTQRIGIALNQYNQFIRTLGERVREYGLTISSCPLKAYQAENKFISSQENSNVIPVHNLFFADEESFVTFAGGDFVNSVFKKKSLDLIGKIRELKKSRKRNQKELNPFYFLSQHNIGNSVGNYPEKLILLKAQEAIDYLKKFYDIDLGRESPKNLRDAIQIESEIFEELDSKYN